MTVGVFQNPDGQWRVTVAAHEFFLPITPSEARALAGRLERAADLAEQADVESKHRRLPP